MNMYKPLLDYYPPLYRRVLEFQLLAAALQPEADALHAATAEVMDAQFVSKAGESGLARYERILGITPGDTDTLSDRRFRVLSRFYEELPYTLRQLRVMLGVLCNGDFAAELTGAYTLDVRVGLTAKKNYEEVERLLRRVVPANVVFALSLLYNQWQTLHPRRWGELSVYSWRTLREEVL